MASVEFRLYDPYNMERYRQVQEIIDIASLVTESIDKTEVTGVFIRFCREVTDAAGCPLWLLREESKARGKKPARLLNLIKKLWVLVNSNAKTVDERQEELDRVRGSLLELIVEQLVRFRYTDIHSNCIVVLDGNDFKHRPTANPKTIDVAGWDCSNVDGEIYECKVNSKKLATNHDGKLEYLVKLQNRLIALNVPAKVGIISAENHYDMKKNFPKSMNLGLIGWPRLFKLKTEKCPA